MGRRRIEIKKIDDQRARRSTFNKRKAGLFKKAWEFGVLTGSKVHLVIEDERKSVHSFTNDKMDAHADGQSIQSESKIGPEYFETAPDSSKAAPQLPDAASPSLVLLQGTDSQFSNDPAAVMGCQNGPGLWADNLGGEIIKDCIEVANPLGDLSLMPAPASSPFLFDMNALPLDGVFPLQDNTSGDWDWFGSMGALPPLPSLPALSPALPTSQWLI